MSVGKRDPLEETVQKAEIVILDIEGTTSSISFVKDTLFPYIRENLESYVKKHWNDEEFAQDLVLLREQAAKDETDKVEGVVSIAEGSSEDLQPAVIRNVLWQMDLDRKTKALKQLQGHVMRDGYSSGKLKGHLFDDVVPALRSWIRSSRQLYIYSSGSVEAQKLLFGHTEEGDLRELFAGHFDTDVGAKNEPGSYSNIIKRIGCESGKVVFFTDVPAEARAARSVGVNAVLVCRPGNAPLSEEDRIDFAVINSFHDVVFETSTKRKRLSAEEESIPVKANEHNEDIEMMDTSSPKVSEESASSHVEKGETMATANIATAVETSASLPLRVSSENMDNQPSQKGEVTTEDTVKEIITIEELKPEESELLENEEKATRTTLSPVIEEPADEDSEPVEKVDEICNETVEEVTNCVSSENKQSEDAESMLPGSKMDDLSQEAGDMGGVRNREMESTAQMTKEVESEMDTVSNEVNLKGKALSAKTETKVENVAEKSEPKVSTAQSETISNDSQFKVSSMVEDLQPKESVKIEKVESKVDTAAEEKLKENSVVEEPKLKDDASSEEAKSKDEVAKSKNDAAIEEVTPKDGTKTEEVTVKKNIASEEMESYPVTVSNEEESKVNTVVEEAKAHTVVNQVESKGDPITEQVGSGAKTTVNDIEVITKDSVESKAVAKETESSVCDAETESKMDKLVEKDTKSEENKILERKTLEDETTKIESKMDTVKEAENNVEEAVSKIDVEMNTSDSQSNIERDESVAKLSPDSKMGVEVKIESYSKTDQVKLRAGEMAQEKDSRMDVDSTKTGIVTEGKECNTDNLAEKEAVGTTIAAEVESTTDVVMKEVESNLVEVTSKKLEVKNDSVGNDEITLINKTEMVESKVNEEVQEKPEPNMKEGTENRQELNMKDIPKELEGNEGKLESMATNEVELKKASAIREKEKAVDETASKVQEASRIEEKIDQVTEDKAIDKEEKMEVEDMKSYKEAKEGPCAKLIEMSVGSSEKTETRLESQMEVEVTNASDMPIETKIDGGKEDSIVKKSGENRVKICDEIKTGQEEARIKTDEKKTEQTENNIVNGDTECLSNGIVKEVCAKKLTSEEPMETVTEPPTVMAMES
ncbi:enolase-phosphatase E1 [Anabrus simplex]|uniref:enolase-phosphatase E1 n=1 Tax=Anabrus simplex TaxID=316456 RepID=UPI0035A33F82